jgi:hypothetical protein
MMVAAGNFAGVTRFNSTGVARIRSNLTVWILFRRNILEFSFSQNLVLMHPHLLPAANLNRREAYIF